MNNIKFKYTFRPYQKRIINEAAEYINDGKVHIVAAPGSGKTIVALKLIFDINAPALVLVPTIAIREQWVERMTNDFENVDSNLISTSLKDVKRYTIITYQALYEYKASEIRKIIEDNDIRLLVFDEAHHLRNAWFKHITDILKDMPKIRTISLTATPPYDDTKLYNNYINLCGEVDTEVEVPELVDNKNLCPHQDFMYFNSISNEEEQKIDSYRNLSFSLAKSFALEEKLIRAIATHRFFIDFKENVNDIIANEYAFVVMLKLLLLNDISVPKEVSKFVVDNSKLTISDMETLIKFVLIDKDEDFKIISKICDKYRSAFTKIGAINKGNVNLLYSQDISKSLSENIGKLDSINTIILHEKESLKDKLKLIVVSDYIKNYQSTDEEKVEDIEDIQIGVIPIFNNIKNKIGKNIQPIVLTGSIILIPAVLKDELISICASEGINLDKVSIKEYDIDFDYLEVNFTSNDKSVKVITELFKKSNANVLVGTTALIGEGWDAPFVNTLIIASNVSTYITSNQIRGRVIRIDPDNKEKVANIWHLVTLEKSNNKFIKGQDYEKIETRLGHIEGLCLSKPEIVKGYHRFEDDIQEGIKLANGLNELNDYMKDISFNREEIASSWKKALGQYEKKDMITIGSFLENASLMQKFIIKNKKSADKVAITTFLSVLVAGYISLFLGALDSRHSSDVMINMTYLVSVMYFVYFFSFIKLASGDNNSLDKMIQAVLLGLKNRGIINKNVEVSLNNIKQNLFLSFKNTDVREQNIVKKCIEEVLSPKHDTRYMIKIGNATYNVPSVFDKTKDSAEAFWNSLQEKLKIRKGKLIFSNSFAGKIERIKSLCETSFNAEKDYSLNDFTVNAKILNDLFKN